MYEFGPTHYYQPYYPQYERPIDIGRWLCPKCSGWIAWWVAVHHCVSGYSYTTNKVKITSDN